VHTSLYINKWSSSSSSILLLLLWEYQLSSMPVSCLHWNTQLYTNEKLSDLYEDIPIATQWYSVDCCLHILTYKQLHDVITCQPTIYLWDMSIVSIIWHNPTSLNLYIHLAVSLQCSGYTIFFDNANNFF
jgi:hypothetical protein